MNAVQERAGSSPIKRKTSGFNENVGPIYKYKRRHEIGLLLRAMRTPSLTLAIFASLTSIILTWQP